MELNELMAEAGKANVEIPADLQEGIENRLGRVRRAHSARIRYAVAASLTALLACSILVGISLDSTTPKDTFDDPELAALEVQKAFGMFADAFNTGKEQTLRSEAIFTQTTQQVKNISK